MRAFVIFALIAVVAARPDIGLQLQAQGGYNYGGQSGSSGSGFSAGGNNFAGSSSGASAGGSFGGSSGGSFGGSSGGSFGGSSGGSFGGSSGGSFGGSSSGGSSGGGVTQGQTQVIDISSGGSSGGVIYKPVVKQGPAQISKHFYVHEAPEEPSNVRVEEKEILVRPQKHYKIIFIKVPQGGASYAGSNAAVFPQNEEKTIVYVLSKKADGVSGDSGDFPQPPPPVTSKPEVFFVKYKTQQEAEGAISKIQETFQDGGVGYNSPGSFAAGLGGGSGSSATSSSFSSGGALSGGGSFGNSGNAGNSGAFSSGSASFGGQFGGSTGGSFGSGYASSDNSLSAQHMIEIPQENSAFHSDYLPPGHGHKK